MDFLLGIIAGWCLALIAFFCRRMWRACDEIMPGRMFGENELDRPRKKGE